MNNLFLYSNKPSNGARELAHAIGAKRIRASGSTLFATSAHTIINWGSRILPDSLLGCGRVLNKPSEVYDSGNKASFFKKMSNNAGHMVPRLPDWTCDMAVAREWVNSDLLVVARTILNGHSGAGIVILNKDVDFVQAPLYTKYVRKEAEYRVHCIRKHTNTNPIDESWAFDVQRKIKDPTFEGVPNWRVRNHQNGFIYIRDDIQVPQDVEVQALRAFEASGLDFGAIDVIWNGSKQQAFILEINTAPGLVGRSVQSYKAAFQSALALPVLG